MSWLRGRRRTVDLDSCERNVDTLNTGVYHAQYDDGFQVQNIADAVVTSAPSIQNTGDAVVTSTPSIQNTDDGVVTSAHSIQNTGNGVVTSTASIQNTGDSAVTSAASIQNTDDSAVTSAASLQSILDTATTSSAGVESYVEGDAAQTEDEDNLIVDKGETNKNIVEDEDIDTNDVFIENEQGCTREINKERNHDAIPQCSHDISHTEFENVAGTSTGNLNNTSSDNVNNASTDNVNNTSSDNVNNTSTDNVNNTSTDNVDTTTTDNGCSQNIKLNDATAHPCSEQQNIEDDFKQEESFKQSVRSTPRHSLDSRLPGLLKSSSMLRDSRISESSISTISENGDDSDVGAARPRKSISWAEDLETVHEFEKLKGRKLSLSALFKKY